jgi:hypothetical protein
MKVAVYSAKSYDRTSLDAANVEHGHDLQYLEPRLNVRTAPLAEGFDAVCAFVNDDLSAPVLDRLADCGPATSRCARPGSTTSTSSARRSSTCRSSASPPTPPTPSRSTPSGSS